MNILVGVSGGIAAYKTCSLVSLLAKNHTVRVIMTEAAKQFVGPLTFETLSNHSLLNDEERNFCGARGLKDETISMVETPGRQIVPHIYYPQLWADVFIVVPATANIIGKAANGIADDFLSSCIIASDKPIMFVPSMNEVMFNNAATQRNLKTLNEDGHIIIEPDNGHLACGVNGKGKLPEIKTINNKIESLLACRVAGYNSKIFE